MSLWNRVAWGSQTLAAQAMASKRAGRVGGRRSAKRRKATRAAAAPARRKRASSKRPARLVKGSPAAKRYMASIRRKRRK